MTITQQADVCVVGGGMAGLTAAIAAARQGARVVLMHERPVLGGNASSEIRVHICGADGHNTSPNLRETGILEELRLENLSRNPNRNFSIWDTILYEKAILQPGLTLLLNCSCLEATMDGEHITSVTGWQMTTQTYQTVEAKIFLDCSGDGILAPLTGAQFRMGREARREYGESIAPEEADAHTMGMTCMFQAREYDTSQPFTPLPWAYTYLTEDELPYGARGHKWFLMGYWWIELGGEDDSIRDTERLRHELLKIAYGVWDHIKNHGDHGAENWALEWVQFLPGKRESRRFIGDHVLTQLDVEAEGRFADLVAYGGWAMDDHHPAGFYAVKLGAPATIFYHSPKPYGIPYRALYSVNIDNLMFSGRNASCTHAAMSSSRVMGTGCSMGQAAGTAAALAVHRGLLPRDMLGHIHELQQTLLRDDCYLPWVPMQFTELTMESWLSASQGDPEPVRDGINRTIGDDDHAWTCRVGDYLMYEFADPHHVTTATLLLDSALQANIAMSLHRDDDQLTAPPPSMPRAFRLDGLANGEWKTLHTVEGNYQRLVRLPIDGEYSALRFTLDETWGSDTTRVFAFYLE
ncbi:MAG TPA: FAD-dependent oxidoreductase [Armatimonadota bacterium]